MYFEMFQKLKMYANLYPDHIDPLTKEEFDKLAFAQKGTYLYQKTPEDNRLTIGQRRTYHT